MTADVSDAPQVFTTKWESQSAIEQLKACFHDNYEKLFGDQWAFSMNLDLLAIGSLLLLFFIGIYVALKRKDSIRIN